MKDKIRKIMKRTKDGIKKTAERIKNRTRKIAKRMKDGMPKIFAWMKEHQSLTFWIGLTVVLFLSIGGLIHVFSNHGSQPAPGAGWFFLKLLLLGLIGGAIATREKRYLSLVLTGMAGLVFLVLLGKFNSLFSWNVLGLPFFATAGIWGVTKTEGRTRSFLGFASGIIILYWMYLFYQIHPIGNTGFINRIFLATDTTKSIFLVFLATFLYSIWRSNKISGKIFFLISFLLLLSFLGNGMVNKIIDRFPKKLTPAISSKYEKTWKKTRDALLDRISKTVAVEKKKKKKKISQKKSEPGRLIMTVVSTHDPVFADALPRPLGPGKYYQVPGGRTSYQFLGESRPRFIGDGRNFSVPEGEIIVGAKTDHKFINIYQRE